MNATINAVRSQLSDIAKLYPALKIQSWVNCCAIINTSLGLFLAYIAGYFFIPFNLASQNQNVVFQYVDFAVNNKD